MLTNPFNLRIRLAHGVHLLLRKNPFELIFAGTLKTMRIPKNMGFQFVLLVLWIVGIVSGAKVWFAYETTPARAAEAPRHWPSNSSFARPTDRFTLVMLAHPNCPCTRASIAELEIIMSNLHGRVFAFVLFSKPGANEAEIRNAALWQKAAAIPDVRVAFDNQAAEASQFDAEVSGQTMLYNPQGDLVFSGGLTSTRGNQGANEGADAIIRIVRSGATQLHGAPLFGCALRNPNAAATKDTKSWTR